MATARVIVRDNASAKPTTLVPTATVVHRINTEVTAAHVCTSGRDKRAEEERGRRVEKRGKEKLSFINRLHGGSNMQQSWEL